MKKYFTIIAISIFFLQCEPIREPSRGAEPVGILSDVSVLVKKESFMRSTETYILTMQDGRKIFTSNALQPLVTGKTLWCNRGLYYQVFPVKSRNKDGT